MAKTQSVFLFFLKMNYPVYIQQVTEKQLPSARVDCAGIGKSPENVILAHQVIQE